MTFSRNDRPSPWLLSDAFEKLCTLLLQQEGYKIVELNREYKLRPNERLIRPDLVARTPGDGRLIIIELKFYRSKRIDPTLIPNAIRQLEHYRNSIDIASQGELANSLLIVTTQVAAAEKDRARGIGIDIWDLDDLVFRTSKHPGLSFRLKELLHDGETGTFGRESYAAAISQIEKLGQDYTSRAEGAQIVAAFSSIAIGRKGAEDYEKFCRRALKYLFAEEFQRWRPAHRVEGGFHVLDLIARLVPKHEFWVSLSLDFSTRYVVFELKNYRDPITQDQIYSTEKYLFEGGLRKIAIIIARAGLDDGARRAVKACLRDAGKLIICLSLDDLKKMLKQKDAGDEYNDLMIDRVSDLMMDLAP